ncbi:MAG: DUF3011 domain-containing protein [Betaproteobacteria bacterium]|jgi:hypothetical protein|nr:DUF3011 domain-containing protein [Betaproteobacteria bacterium]
MPPMIAPFLAVAAVAALAALASAPAHAQVRLQCESRNHQYQFCSTGMGITHAVLVRQISGAACIEGSTWGWDRRGVWVSRGCAGVFEVGDYRPPPSPPVQPGRDIMTCESRDYQHNFCATDARIVSASVVRQISRVPCVLGRNWGWRGNGIWVSEGCEADFRIRTEFRPPPPAPAPGITACESHEYRYNFCPTGPIRDVQLVEQRSQAPCVLGRSWGWRRDGIWVDSGCEGVFRVRSR